MTHRLVTFSGVAGIVLVGVLLLRFHGNSGSKKTGHDIGPHKTLILGVGESFPRIPGDPHHVVPKLEKIYRQMIAFRAKYHRLPRGRQELVTRVIPGFQITLTDLQNPDALTPDYANSYPRSTETGFAFNYKGKRYDGVRKPAVPKPGERDVWVISYHYLRSAMVGQAPNRKERYFGSLVGLFSDGKVEITEAVNLVGVRLANNAFAATFPDQTGLPSDVLPLDQMTDTVAKAVSPVPSRAGE